MQFTQVIPQKIFLASMEVTEAGEAAEAENFPKNKYGSKCLELPNSARKAKKIFTHYKFSKASWPSVKGQKAVLNS